MKVARIRLVIAAVLMLGWLGYLGYLALWHSKPIVVSRSQLLNATHYVKAEVTTDAANKPVSPVQVIESFGGNRIADKTIELTNIADVRLPDQKPLTAGTYFFPLVSAGPGRYRVVSAFSSDSQVKLIAYPWTAEVEGQVRELVP
jgi:hypothetical protein